MTGQEKPDSRHATSPGAAPWLLAATILGSSLAFINSSSVNVALPAMQATFAVGVGGLQWISNAYTLLLASLILPGGALGDRVGRRRVFMLGTALFGVASVGCGLAPTFGWLLVARALQGVGGALLAPASLALIRGAFAAEAQGRAIGLWAGLTSLAAALGPLLGGWLVDAVSWRWIFFIHAPLSLTVLALSWWRVPARAGADGAGPFDWRGTLLVTAGLAALNVGLIRAAEQSLRDPWVLGAAGGGLLLLLAFLWVEARAANPLLPLALFRVTTFSGGNGLTFLLYMAFGGLFFFTPLYLIQVAGYTATAAGAALLPTVLLLAALSSWMGGLLQRVPARWLLTVGPVVAAVGFFLFRRATPGASYWTTLFPATAVLGLGMAISVAPLTTTVLDAVDEVYAGTASGINNAAARVANLMAVALLGVVMVQTFGAALAPALDSLNLPASARATILARQSDLAELQPPSGLSPAQQAAVGDAVDRAFLHGYRLIAAITAALALGSALIAWLTIHPDEKKEGGG